MGFFSLIVALLLEQARPLQDGNAAYSAVRSFAEAIERNFNAGEKQHGVIAWLIVVLPLALGSWIIFELLCMVQPFLAIVWNVLVLYFTLGFRQFSHYFTDIQLALAENDLNEARRLLETWKRLSEPKFSAAELELTEVCRLAIEEALVASHRHVFGVFFWFVLLPGPAGAVLYRLSDYLARKWNAPDLPRGEPFGEVATRAFGWVDWVPVRLSAIGFAIVGNFEDAVFYWRNSARRWTDLHRGIILSAGAGALGLRLGDARSLRAEPTLSAETGQAPVIETLGDNIPGVDASPAAMRTFAAWRDVVPK